MHSNNTEHYHHVDLNHSEPSKSKQANHTDLLILHHLGWQGKRKYRKEKAKLNKTNPIKCDCTNERERENSHTETWVVFSDICCSSNTGKSESPNDHLQTQKNRRKNNGIFIYVSV